MSTSAPLKPAKAGLMQPGRKRRWLFRLLAMTLVPCLFFVLFEVVLRFSGYGYSAGFFLSDRESVGTPVLVANSQFKRRFFPNNLAKGEFLPSPFEFPAAKRSGTCRIFILGESAAYGFPEPAYSFSRILEAMLRHRYPGVAFEVVNTSVAAINSHAVLCIARECAQLEPDAFVVLLGNNEVVGPFGAAGVVGPFVPTIGLIRANLWAKTFRTGQCVDACLESLRSPNNAPPGWKGMETMAKARVPADDERMNAIHRNFRANLQDICAAGTAAGASVFVCTVPVNLRDCAPFASAHRSNLGTAEETAWSREYDEGVRLEKAAKFAEALERYGAAAAAIDDRFADLAFRQARCCLALKQTKLAQKFFVQARDLDALQFRSDTRTNNTIRDGCAEWGAHLVDVEAAFAGNSPDGLPGEEFFLEHVHLAFPGNCLLARSVFTALRDRLPNLGAEKTSGNAEPLSDSECAARLAFSKWHEYGLLQYIGKEMFPSPPFNAQLDHQERAERWSRKLNDLKPLLGPAGMEKAAADFERVIQDWPSDATLRSRYARLLVAMNNPLDAEKQMWAALERAPRNHQTLTLLANQLAKSGRPDEAAKYFHKALRFAPDSSEAHLGLGQVLLAQGKIKESIAICAARANADANPVEALMHWSFILAHEGRDDEAKAKLQEAAALQPTRVDIHIILGDMAAKEADLKEALRQFDQALKLDPELPGLSAQVSKLQETLKH